MATRFELVLEGDEPSRLRAIAEEAFEEIRICESSWSAFAKESVISNINRDAFAGPVLLDSQTWFLLEEALRISEDSAGWFDPTLAPLMERFGFRGEDRVGQAHLHWGSVGVRLDEATRSVRFEHEGLRLDLGGIAKGRALDLAAEVLRDNRIERALLHGGTSSVVALGAPAGLAGWRVALAQAEGAPVAVLADCALSVSGTAGRTSAAGGHVINPHAGSPAATPSTSAVVAPRASIADAWSTAICAAGERELELPSTIHALQCLGQDSNEWIWRSAPTPSIQFPDDPAFGPALRA